MTVRWTFEDYWAGRAKRSTFLYTGSVQHFVVPPGVTAVSAGLRGAFGGGKLSNGVYLGGYIQGVLPVAEGDTLNIYVGGLGHAHDVTTAGVGGWNGGGDGGTGHSGKQAGDGGGGATDIRVGGTDLAHRVVVAAGAGGNSGNGLRGGPGGPWGAHAWSSDDLDGGLGANGDGPGKGGLGNTPAGDGSLGQGGDGASAGATVTDGSGGGGGGQYGGGGGGHSSTGSHSAAGGGAGNNDVDGFDQSQPILNERGALAQSAGRLIQPSVEIGYSLETDVYTFDINPDADGTPTMQKNIAVTQNTGPNRVAIMQEGQSTGLTSQFSGVILSQQQLEAMESWFDKRIFIKMTDDLGREIYGVFASFAPRRVRRPLNPWFHTFDASIAVAAYRDASGNWRYGRVA